MTNIPEEQLNDLRSLMYDHGFSYIFDTDGIYEELEITDSKLNALVNAYHTAKDNLCNYLTEIGVDLV